MFYQLPPVGNPIRLSSADQPYALLELFGDAYRPHYFASGTAALSAAISAAIRFKTADKPEVILPAYACPDLISAAIFAGAKPVLVDLEADRPWMDLEQLPEKITAQTVAIIAINLFGIAERLEQLRTLTEQTGALLIEDSAQAFPGDNEKGIWQGDLVVLSFGRGKPVTLLGGGAVLCNQETLRGSELTRLLPEASKQAEANIPQQIAFWLKAHLYNWMINPGLYWIPKSLPFLQLGETHYHPLSSINAMDKRQLSMLPANVKAYQSNSMNTQNQLQGMLNELDQKNSAILDLPSLCKCTKARRLLRYPLLVEQEFRDQLVTKLQGLGVSKMYPAILPKINGLENTLPQGEFPEAISFSKRILTLPTHSHVGKDDIDKMFQHISH